MNALVGRFLIASLLALPVLQAVAEKPGNAGGGRAKGGMGKDIMESLNLSPEQKESVKAYKLEKGKLKNLIAAEHEEQVAYQALVSQASSTPEALRAQAAKLAAAQAL